MATARPDADVLDVAVVGGGVAGIYSAWRLATSTRKQGLKVAVFESGTRVGGRLLSLVPPGIPTARVEVGGMRYTSTHLQVAGLVDYLGLATEPFAVGEPDNLAYVRGKRLRSKDLGKAKKIPYNLAKSDLPGLATGMTALAAENFLKIVLNKKTVDLKTVDWVEVARTGRYEGKRLTDLSMRYIFTKSVSQEAFQYAYDTSGYDSIFYTWSAADGFPWNLDDYGATVSYNHVKDGYLSIVLQLQELLAKAGGSVQLQHRLVSFDATTLHDGTPGVRLELAAGVNGQRITKLARQLILAMPRRSIDLLDQTGVLLDKSNTAVRALIGSVAFTPLFKLALAYKTRWWEKVGVSKGQTVTDLPIRQCYYWPVEDPKTKNGVLLVYDDGQDLDFWASLRSRAHGASFTSTVKGPPAPANFPKWDDFPAPAMMVAEAHRQLLEVHGVTAKKQYAPYSAAYMDWGEDPFGGGANFWPLFVDSQTVSKKILQPMPNVPVFICGEAYSHQQGWVEGALATTEQMLQGRLGLEPPPPPLVSPK